MITIDEFKKGEISVGEIVAAEIIEGSDKLFKLTVNFGLKQSTDRSPEHSAEQNVLGEEKDIRTVVSGIRKYFPGPEAIVGVKCAFATNLEPRTLMGLTSEAMILAVSDENVFSLLRVADDVPVGLKVK